MKRIIFTGAQGTGKTTVLNHYKDKGYKVITEVVRNLSKTGVKINEMGDGESQDKIFNTYVDLLSKKENYISDRGLTDVVSYSSYLCRQMRIPIYTFLQEIDAMKEFNELNKDITYCYFPIEFDVVDDGVRSTDESFRKEISDNIKMFLDYTKIPYVTITGTVEERIAQVDKLL